MRRPARTDVVLPPIGTRGRTASGGVATLPSPPEDRHTHASAHTLFFIFFISPLMVVKAFGVTKLLQVLRARPTTGIMIQSRGHSLNVAEFQGLSPDGDCSSGTISFCCNTAERLEIDWKGSWGVVCCTPLPILTKIVCKISVACYQIFSRWVKGKV